MRDSDLTVLFAWTNTQEAQWVLSGCERYGREPVRIRSAVRPNLESHGSFYLIDREREDADLLEPERIKAVAALLQGRLTAPGVLHIAGNRLRHFEAPAEAFLTAVFREMLGHDHAEGRQLTMK